MRRFKMAAASFAAAAVFALVANTGANAAEESTCTPKACDLAGGASICCLIGTGSMTCSPCGASEPVYPEEATVE